MSFLKFFTIVTTHLLKAKGSELIRCVTTELYGWILTSCHDNIPSGSLNMVFKRGELNPAITVSLDLTADRQLVFYPDSKYREMTNQVSVRISSGCELQKILLGSLTSLLVPVSRQTL